MKTQYGLHWAPFTPPGQEIQRVHITSLQHFEQPYECHSADKTQAQLLHIDDVTHNKHGTRGLPITPAIQMLFNNKELPKIAATM